MKKPKRNEHVLGILAGDVSQTRWMLGLNTAVRGFKELQSDISNERDKYAAEFARQQIKHAANSEKGGAASVQVRRSERAPRNIAIASEARRLMAPPSKRAPREICSMLKDNAIAQGLSIRQIRTILQDEGVLEKRRK
jgi:hypothetical protein